MTPEDKSAKPQWSYLPNDALNEIALAWHYSNSPTPEYPNGKYPKNNWRNNPHISWTQTIDSLLRHIADFREGQIETDPESKRHVLGNAGCRLLMLLQMALTRTGNDDRFIHEEPTK